MGKYVEEIAMVMIHVLQKIKNEIINTNYWHTINKIERDYECIGM